MKKILIVGEGSFIGNAFYNWLSPYRDLYQVSIISSITDEWKNKDFSKYDVILNVAGIAHIKIKASMEPLFYKVNRNLAIAIARKGKKEGVKQYIYLSSMNVYGDTNDEINGDTKPNPSNFYGKSKLQADMYLQRLGNQDFKVVSIRPPVVYGKGCKGNFTLLEKIVKKSFIFPNYPNIRSMIYIDNLCEFLKLIIDHEERGIFHPQNKDYISTTQLAKLIAKANNKKLYCINWLNPIITFFVKRVRIVNRAFGNDYYAKSLSSYKNFSYCLFNYEESINAMYKDR